MRSHHSTHGIFQRDVGLVVVLRHVHAQHALVALRRQEPAGRADLLQLLAQRQCHVLRPQRVDRHVLELQAVLRARVGPVERGGRVGLEEERRAVDACLSQLWGEEEKSRYGVHVRRGVEEYVHRRNSHDFGAHEFSGSEGDRHGVVERAAGVLWTQLRVTEEEEAHLDRSVQIDRVDGEGVAPLVALRAQEELVLAALSRSATRQRRVEERYERL